MLTRKAVWFMTTLILALSFPVLPLAAEAQQPTKVYRIGHLGTNPPTTGEPARLWAVFRQASICQSSSPPASSWRST